MKFEWSKVIFSISLIYALIYSAFKLFTLAFFPDFYFGPIHALSLLLLLFLFLGIVEYFRNGNLDEDDRDDLVFSNTAVTLIAAVVSNGNTLEIPSYIVKGVMEKLEEEKLKLTIEETDDKYILKVEIE